MATRDLKMSVRWTMAVNPNTPSHVLEELMSEGAPTELLERIAEHPRATSEILAQLAEHDDPEVRAAVADNKNASDSILAALAEDTSPDVRYSLAENPNLPLAVLKTLTEDENPFVAHRAQRTVQRIVAASATNQATILPPGRYAQRGMEEVV